MFRPLVFHMLLTSCLYFCVPRSVFLLFPVFQVWFTGNGFWLHRTESERIFWCTVCPVLSGLHNSVWSEKQPDMFLSLVFTKLINKCGEKQIVNLWSFCLNTAFNYNKIYNAQHINAETADKRCDRDHFYSYSMLVNVLKNIFDKWCMADLPTTL